jgi:hypothetical protein
VPKFDVGYIWKGTVSRDLDGSYFGVDRVCGDLRPGMLALNNLGRRLGRSSLLCKFIS